MTTAIFFLVIGVIVDIFIMRMHKKEESTPFVPEWSLDEGVSFSDESRAVELLAKYGKIDEISLPATFVISQSVKEIVEKYATMEFDRYTMDYNRKDLLKGEESEEYWKGFYCIGGDGGEISFYVRKSIDDEKVYAFDMEGSTRPEPYASNIRRFIVMRYNAWCNIQKMIAEDEAAKLAKKNGRDRRNRA